MHPGLPTPRVDLGLAERKTLKHWQAEVVASRFDADVAARELSATAQTPGEGILADRAGRLLRDFVMAPTLRGAQGAARAARQRTKSGVAYLLAQGLAFAAFTLILLLCMLFLRLKGTSFDEFFDRILDLFRSPPAEAG